MTAFLLDVNVLIALLHEEHVNHRTVQRWFREGGEKHWATCPLTQSGFVRIVSNPGFSDHPTNIKGALQMLSAVTQLPGHQFWPISIGLLDAVERVQQRLHGHRQLTDAYLLGIAVHNKGRLVTLDQGILELAGEELSRHLLTLQ